MNDAMYQLIVGTLDLLLWGGKLIGEENLPHEGPAVFIANHLEASGPIAASCSIPLRLYSWMVADMVDYDLASAYLNWDFVERTLHLRPPASTWFAGKLSRLTVPFLRSLGCIPVYKGDYQQMTTTLRLSMDLLRRGKFLLIFPEDNLLPKDPETGMAPFQRSFARLGEMYYADAHRRLEFYPAAIHPKGYVILGKPIVFNPLNPVGMERSRLKDLMEDGVRRMFLQVENDLVSELPGLTL